MAKTTKTIQLTKSEAAQRIVAQIDTETLPLLRPMTRGPSAEVLQTASGLAGFGS